MAEEGESEMKIAMRDVADSGAMMWFLAGLAVLLTALARAWTQYHACALVTPDVRMCLRSLGW